MSEGCSTLPFNGTFAPVRMTINLIGIICYVFFTIQGCYLTKMLLTLHLEKMFCAIYRIMTTNKLPLYFLIAMMMAVFSVGCNSDSETLVIDGDFGNCTVSSFNLKKDDSVLVHLDSVYFSIDLVKAEIFNADSLPKGTDVSKVLVNINTSSASKCDLTWRIPGTMRDTTVNYIDQPNDSVNFADGPVKMLVVSSNGQTKRNYTIRVNVHQVEPDTLYWDKLAMTTLPGEIDKPTMQKTVEFGGQIVNLTSDGNSASVSKCANPYNSAWSSESALLPANANISSFTATSDALYIIDGVGNLYTSADGATWIPTGTVMSYIYGGYEDKVLGVRYSDGAWTHLTYPATDEQPVASGCPVSGTGQMMVYETKWSVAPLAMFVGGKDASGMLVGSAWGYDGKKWAKISNTDIDEREDVSLFPYMTPKVNKTNWKVTERSVLVALGGKYEITGGPVVSKTVYISYDQGLNWKEADSYMQLPEYISGFSGAQAIVMNATLSDSRSFGGSWTSYPSRRLPAWATPVPEMSLSRAVKPVTEWECPYIYLFGGEDALGNLYDTVWRGAITRFTFKPLY